MAYSRITQFLLVTIGAAALAAGADEPCEVSLVRVVANPAEFDQASVRLTGVLSVSHDHGFGLYLDVGSYEARILINALQVELWQQDVNELACFEGKWTTVEGRFEAIDSRLESLFSGEVRDVTALVAEGCGVLEIGIEEASEHP